MNNMPWYMRLLNDGTFDGEGWWAIKPDGNIVRETIEDVTNKLEKELLSKYNESKKSKNYKWEKTLSGYEIVLETPGIQDFDSFKFENGKLVLKCRNVVFGRQWSFNESLELPVAANEIDTIDYETISGVTKIALTMKLPEKDIKIVNRNKADTVAMGEEEY